MEYMKCIKDKSVALMAVTMLLTAFADVAIGMASIEAIAETFPYEHPVGSTTIGLFLVGLVLGLLAGLLFMYHRQLYTILSSALLVVSITVLLLVGTHISSRFNQICVAIVSCLCAFTLMLSYGIIRQESMMDNLLSNTKVLLLAIVLGALCGLIVPYLFTSFVSTFICLGSVVVAFVIALFPLPKASSDVASY